MDLFPRIPAPDIGASMQHFQAIADAQAEAIEAPTARRAVRQLQREIQAFEAALDSDSDVGVRLVAFGPSIVVHVTDVGYYQPNLVVLVGQTGDGSPVRIVQHISQLSILLVKAPRLDPDSPRPQIGFHSYTDEVQSAP